MRVNFTSYSGSSHNNIFSMMYDKSSDKLCISQKYYTEADDYNYKSDSKFYTTFNLEDFKRSFGINFIDDFFSFLFGSDNAVSSVDTVAIARKDPNTSDFSVFSELVKPLDIGISAGVVYRYKHFSLHYSLSSFYFQYFENDASVCVGVSKNTCETCSELTLKNSPLAQEFKRVILKNLYAMTIFFIDLKALLKNDENFINKLIDNYEVIYR